MTRDQLDLIPDHMFEGRKHGCRDLIAWLHARGWQMTLLELTTERRHRGIRARIG